jgi:putative beta-lysine N-acetyltransferase
MNDIKSTLSHNKASNRVYLMHLHAEDFPHIITHLDALADEHEYSKIFAKIPFTYTPAFISEGYIIEATIPNFFKGKEDAAFVVKYKNKERRTPNKEALTAFQQLVFGSKSSKPPELASSYSIRTLKQADIDAMTTVFKAVFKSYPFPIFEAKFIEECMENKTAIYFGAFYNNQLIAVSATECNSEELYAEMTDFAVLPSHRGNRLAIHLLHFMETHLEQQHFKTFFSICRLNELSMNKTFLNCGYKFSGTLVNNTQIAGTIESMNVWYKLP